MTTCQLRFPSLRAKVLFALCLILAGTAAAQSGQADNSTAVILDKNARAAVAVDGLWQFHTGDNPAWADPSVDDSTWEQLSADRPWGEQGHASYAGFAWYRKRITVPSAGHGSTLPIALLVPHLDSAYEVYWNGKLIGRDGKLPPHPVYYLTESPPRVFHFNAGEHGLLCFRVWKGPLLSDDSGKGGGFLGLPMAGGDEAIATQLSLVNYEWLRSQQFYFSVNLIYGLVALLSLLAWFQDRKQWPLFWMFGYALAPIVEMLFYGARIPWPSPVANALWQPITSLRDICLWYLLLWLLQLRQNQSLARLVRVCAWISVISGILDSAPYFLAWMPGLLVPMQIEDAIMTAAWVPTGAVPLVLVIAAVRGRSRLDFARWAMAIFAFTSGMIQVVRTLAPQGSRFTHWTIADRIEAPLFEWAGNSVSAPTLSGTLLLMATGYAVYRNSRENRLRQTAMEQEFKSARELQRVLIPEALPIVPGFALTSGYLPAQQVGGDFFQIIPLEGNAAGSTLVVLGDVSGKGLRAAMAVSFIVGVLRALANLIPSPARLLSELNQRLIGRLQGGFATCIVLLLKADGDCVIASAGHPAAFVNSSELNLPGAFPLGLVVALGYDETTIHLDAGDRCTLYTDGLLEARNPSGEVYGFERLRDLLSARPDAAEAVDAAVRFGQDDDITVVTLTRTSSG